MKKAFFIPQITYEEIENALDLTENGYMPTMRFNSVDKLVTKDSIFGDIAIKLYTNWHDLTRLLCASASIIYVVEIDDEDIYIRISTTNEIENNKPVYTGFWK